MIPLINCPQTKFILPESVPFSPQEPQQNLISKCLDLLENSQNRTGFDVSQDLWVLLLQNSPEIQEKIDLFKKEHAEKCAILQEKSWSTLKSELGDKMATEKGQDGLTFNAFRENAKQLQEQVSLEIGRTLGLPSGSWKATGSCGYDHDIDNVFYPDEKNASEVGQILVKILADTFWVYTFGNKCAYQLSDTQIDLNTYLEHPGSTRNTAARIEFDQKAKRQFNRLELSMAMIQMRRVYINDLEEWKKYKAEFLERVKDNKEFAAAMVQIFKEVDAFESTLNCEIYQLVLKEYNQSPDNSTEAGLRSQCLSLTKNDPEAFKRVSLLLKIRKSLSLSKMIDDKRNQLDTHIRTKEKIYPHASAHCQSSLNSMKNKLNAPLKKKKESQSNYKEENPICHQLEIEIATLSAHRNVLFDESYLTQAAYNTACTVEGGQMAQRRDEEIISLMQQNAHVPIQKKVRRYAQIDEWAISGLENQKFLAKILHAQKDCAYHPGKSNELMQDALIESAKYIERLSLDCLSALKLSQNSQNTPTEKLILHAKNLYRKAAALEKCKRKEFLDRAVTVQLLTQELTPHLYQMDLKLPWWQKLCDVIINVCNCIFSSLILSYKQKKMISEINQVVIFFEIGGKFYKEELSIEDKCNVAMSHLADRKLISLTKTANQIMCCDNDRINAIIQSKAGVSRLSNTLIDQIHKEAKPLTLKINELESTNHIQKYISDLMDLSALVASRLKVA